MFAPEGPKLLRRGGWFYLLSAVGGTAGPPTSHMVTLARARSIHGPWEHCPHNPIVRTRSADEPWWSRGHASLVEGPAGDWWMVYHGYENGFRTLGRQTLLEPVAWTNDGWLRAKGGTLAAPLPKPRGGQPGPAGFALSDDFSSNRLGPQWSFHAPAPDEAARLRHEPGGLVLRGKGSAPFDDEGVRTRARRVVDGGVVQGYFLSSYSARKLGMKTTGHAGGSQNLTLTSRLTKPADDLDAMLKKLGRGLFVTELMGQGVNFVTGDYSRGAAGFWVENGKIAFPVEEVTVAGNLREMLMDIRAVGGDVDPRSHILVGSILVGKMTVAGA